ncbi:hypothetical protein Pan216_17480 [Planctomycetes bacterium Pan216]|uniref:Uncharacterized protein n=1 Tax=Kolteria novifilia TaxID=2527975 RepID=A0A518B1N9_9BACT|nr:hypothetical protein Pan216_17480 [Planctomycetes bacterium Pan216]
MADTYHEVVVEGPTAMVKGFIAGYLVGRGLASGEIMFAGEQDIVGESLGERFSEWVGLHHYTHLIVPDRLFPELKRDFGKIEETLRLSIAKERLIKSASFAFRYRCYNRGHAEQLEELVQNIPEGIILTGYEVKERVDPTAEKVELYSPTHPYESTAHGTLHGDVRGIVAFHEKCEQHDLMDIERIAVHYVDGDD